MAVKKNKLKVAIIALTSCEGCQFVLLDKGKRFFDWLKQVDLEEFRLIEDKPMPEGNYDLCIVEGTPITKANVELLQEMRRRSKLLVVLGNCAALGGVWEIKNYRLKAKTIRQVYKQNSAVENPTIKEVDNFVKVDLTIPGCPINGDEALEALTQLLAGRIMKLPQNPVCNECQSHGYQCLLQKGEICLGPITLGGCQAICLKSKQACWGCRGLFEGAQITNFLTYLKKHFTLEQINQTMEVFGFKDQLSSALSAIKDNKKSKHSK